MTVDRDATQQKLAKLGAATLQHRPSQKYTVGDRIEEKAAAHPERPFLFYEDRRLTYAELNAEANRVAHVALQAGLVTGDVVSLMMENRPEFIASWAGLAKLGVTVALINTNVRGRPPRHALETAGAKHLIVGSECLENLTSLGEDLARTWTLYVSPDPADPRGHAQRPAGALNLSDALL